MCIYCDTDKYRKIYEHHHGSIPKDENDRTYEIHHIDNNHSNNDPSNLKCVTIQEHYDIHYSQKDWGACLKISKRMKLSSDEIGKLSRLTQLKRINNGTHPFLKNEVQQKRIESVKKSHKKRVNDNTHQFIGGSIQREDIRKRKENGTYHMYGSNNPMYDNNLYCFQNKLSKEIVTMTRSDFIKVYSLRRGDVSNLIKGKVKSVKSWILLYVKNESDK
jgi:hypothetical protein